MRKYWLVFTNSLATILTYRANLFWRMLGQFVSTGILYLLWSTILSTGFGADKYTQSSLIMYYLALTFAEVFITFDYHPLANDIRNGYLSTYLLQPNNYFIKLFIEGMASRLIKVIILLPVLIYLFRVENLGIVLLTIGLSIVVRFLLSMIVGCLTFWFNRVHGFNAAIFTIGGLFSGELIPTDLLPEKIQIIANFLPFKYFSFVPVKYLSGNFEGQNILVNFQFQIIWLVFFMLLTIFFWKSGLKKYESVGR